LSWQFAGGQVSRAGGTIVAALTLPLLRGAGRYVRLEGLIQAERNLLYNVREFARFRRQFYFETLNSYYRLLGQVQSIRNTRTNLQSLQLNLVEHQELLERKMVAQIQVDQVFQDYQSGRLSLLSAEQSLADALDGFKFQLGLPTWAKVKIDETLLKQFEFVSSDIESMQQETNVLYTDLLKFLPPRTPNQEQAAVFFDRYETMLRRIENMLPQVMQEFASWKAKLDAFDELNSDTDDRLDHQQQEQIANQLAERLADLEQAINDDLGGLEKLRRLADNPELIKQEPDHDNTMPVGEARWDRLQRAVGRRLREHIAELYTAQVQCRVFSIELEPVRLSQEAAMQFAVENRLDLMNSRAQTMDAYRKVQVAANALKSQLDVRASANLGTDPDRTNPLRIDASANTYNVGVSFDGPLNRLNERNAYRATQIGFQQARRAYMANEDAILNSIRANLRQLSIQRLNFQIARQQLVAATRQVDEAQINLRTAAQSSTNLTRDLLQALQGLLGSKNNLISSWIGYQTSRISLFVDLELLYLDEQGRWINEDQSLNDLQSLLQQSDQREELSRIYGILRSPLFQSVDGGSDLSEIEFDLDGEEGEDGQEGDDGLDQLDFERQELPEPNGDRNLNR
jgi:outer membrane protein TolC